MSEKMKTMFEVNNRMRRAQEAALEEQERRERMERIMHHRMIMFVMNVGTGCMTAIAGINLAMGNWKMGAIGFALVAAVTVYGYFLDKRFTQEVL